ncbi:MAG: glycoside hydrolase family 1 protein [Schleiferilactobacillus perolens]|uniref:glycoside hydrolase family 1 protein n=1 Tax=Schleiferilactobacillus perolens TaxID=100468 RepID=UPI0039E8496A
MSKQTFPDGFLWGGATSAYQFEGARDEDGKSRSIVDNSINAHYTDTSITSDHYHHWREDVALMKELGLNSYRFSIAWPRIIPSGNGATNLKGIKFYSDLIDALLVAGIEPVVTIYHFDLPQTLQDQYGGWRSRQIIADFDHYCYVLYKNFGDRVKYWLTINEQSNMFALPYLLNLSGDESEERVKFQMNHHMMLANAQAIIRAHEMMPHAIIGPAIGLSPYYALTADPQDVIAAHNATVFRNDFFTDLYFKGTYHPEVMNYLVAHDLVPDMEPNDSALLMNLAAKPDYLGINYYESKTVRAAPRDTAYHSPAMSVTGEDVRVGETRPGLYQEVANSHLPTNEWHWEIDPAGLRILLHQIYDRYGVPLIITENGIGGVEQLTSDHQIHDDYRIDFLDKHLVELRQAIAEGVDVIGYEPWSFMDLLSTTNGFRKRYGFVYVNRTDEDLLDLNRYKKDSFYWYQKVIETNGASL